MQIKQQAPACVWYQPRKIKASPEGRDPFAAGSQEYHWSQGGNEDPRLPRQILNWTRLFKKIMLEQTHHLPFPPPKRELLQSCKHFYHVFTNSALDELSQIFSRFAPSEATDIHPRGVGGTCPDTLNIPLQAFLNTAPASPCTLNTQILLQTHGDTGEETEIKTAFLILPSECNLYLKLSNVPSHSHLHYTTSHAVIAQSCCRGAEMQQGLCSSNNCLPHTMHLLSATGLYHLTQDWPSQAHDILPLGFNFSTVLCNIFTTHSLKSETIWPYNNFKVFFFSQQGQ